MVTRKKEIFAITVFCVAIYLCLALIIPKSCGGIGEWFSQKLNDYWGYAAFLIPLSMLGFSGSILCKGDAQCWVRGISIGVIILSFDIMMGLCFPYKFGLIAAYFSSFLSNAIGMSGSVLSLAFFSILAITQLLKKSFFEMFVFFHSKGQLIPASSGYSSSAYMNNPWKLRDQEEDSIKLHDVITTCSDTIGRKIENFFQDFGIRGVKVVGEIKRGPLISLYYMSLPRGVKCSSVSSLDSDLARALEVASCRIISNIEGRTEIGIEVPNNERSLVSFSEIINSNTFSSSKDPLTLVLGKNTSGMVVLGDLAQMHHLLIAGTTGSGKSMVLLSLLIGMVIKNNPDQLKMILIDPKRIELSCFNGIGHLAMPVIDDQEQAIRALRWCADEMERRYNLFQKNGVRSLGSYNLRTDEPLPRIIIVIDEFSDLIMGSSKEVEGLIIRLAQKARSCGMHIIISTQRPDSQVITGLIKANFSTRICLRTSSKSDSRIVLDQGGAEKLLGNGDMLVSQMNRLDRVHGPFIADTDIEEILGKVKVSYPNQQYIDFNTDGWEEIEEEKKDDLFSEVLSFIQKEGRASVRMLRRRFAIGDTRAARLIDQLEKNGYISSLDEHGCREVLI